MSQSTRGRARKTFVLCSKFHCARQGFLAGAAPHLPNPFGLLSIETALRTELWELESPFPRQKYCAARFLPKHLSSLSHFREKA